MPKLNLRDLFWLVLVAAMGLGWLAATRQHKADLRRTSESHLKDIERMEYKLWRADPISNGSFRFRYQSNEEAESLRQEWNMDHDIYN